VADEIELVGFLTLAEDELSGFKAHVGCSSNQKLEVAHFQTAKKRMFRNQTLDCFHLHPSLWRFSLLTPFPGQIQFFSIRTATVKPVGGRGPNTSTVSGRRWC
jgi:hypothetical protein